MHELQFHPSGDIPGIAKSILASRSGPIGARDSAITQSLSPRAQRIIAKAAVSGGSFGDVDYGDVLSDWRIARNAFFTSLRTRSVFFRLLDSGFRKVPLRTNLGIVTANATAWIVNEGAPTPLTAIKLSSPTLEPVKACALMVMSDTISRSMSEGATEAVNVELRGAVSDVVDAKFFSMVIDSDTPTFASSGRTAANILTDLRKMLAAVNTTGAGLLAWAMAPDVANGVVTSGVTEISNGMTPLGGEMLGLPALVSSTVPAGTLRLINASAIAANSDEIFLDASAEADVQMVDDPSVGAASVLVSMYQTNNVCLKAVVSFGAERTRDNAVALLTGVQWGVEQSS
jgi:hypothetical protein